MFSFEKKDIKSIAKTTVLSLLLLLGAQELKGGGVEHKNVDAKDKIKNLSEEIFEKLENNFSAFDPVSFEQKNTNNIISFIRKPDEPNKYNSVALYSNLEDNSRIVLVDKDADGDVDRFILNKNNISNLNRDIQNFLYVYSSDVLLKQKIEDKKSLPVGVTVFDFDPKNIECTEYNFGNNSCSQLNKEETEELHCKLQEMFLKYLENMTD